MIASDPTAYDAVTERGRSALAWEVLRRDPDYRAAFERLPRIPAADVAAAPGFVARWGLHFR